MEELFFYFSVNPVMKLQIKCLCDYSADSFDDDFFQFSISSSHLIKVTFDLAYNS